MSIVGNKDSRRMEVVRYLDEDEDLYFSVLNRPVEDIEQRTKDLNRQIRPGRAFEVHQTFPASLSIQVASGWYMQEANQKPLFWPESGDTDTFLIPVAGAGTYRCDLITFFPEDGTIDRSQGSAEASWANAWTNRARVPSSTTGKIPLAYVYVDDSGTFFRDTIAVNNPGHIRDVRSAFGSGRRIFEEDISVFQTDLGAVGAFGSAFKIARADHQHPPKVVATLPQALSPDNVAANGTSDDYSRRDHTHGVTLETVAANLLSDTSGGALGTANKFVRSDHQHELNVTASPVPAQCSGVLASISGTSEYYSRRDHRHQVVGATLNSQPFQINFVNTTGEHTAAVDGTDDWLWAWIVYSGNVSGPGLSGGPRPATNWGWLGSGFSVFTPGMARATGMLRTRAEDNVNTKLSVDFNSTGSNDFIGGSMDYAHTYDVSNNVDEVPYDTYIYKYWWHCPVWEFNEDPIVSGTSLGWNCRMTTWNQPGWLVGLTANKPIGAFFSGLVMTQG